MLLFTFNWKKTFPCLFFHCFFIVILENPAPFSLNFCSPMTYFSMERSSHIAPSPQPHPQNQKKNPRKPTVHFPITIIICKHWSKFVYAEQNGYLKILICWLWRKNEHWRGPRCPPIFWSLKKGTRTFHFRQNEPSCDILGPLGQYDDPWGKKQTNKHTPVICLLAKNTKFHFFVDRSL